MSEPEGILTRITLAMLGKDEFKKALNTKKLPDETFVIAETMLTSCRAEANRQLKDIMGQVFQDFEAYFSEDVTETEEYKALKSKYGVK